MRDDFTFSYDARGRHDLKAGGEFVRHYEDSENCNNCGGSDRRQQRHHSAPTSLQAIFPDPFNVDTWNLAALSPYTRTYTIGIGEFPLSVRPAEVRAPGCRTTGALATSLTLNLGCATT